MLEDFLGGAVAMGFAVAALFFLKFWRRTREGLFLAFSASFLLLAATQALLTLSGIPTEERSWLYLLRLVAFLLILGAMWWQNRRGRDAG
jgi:zinc transporter ZupT